MDEERLCRLCGTAFDTALLLPCSHTICASCLTGPGRRLGAQGSKIRAEYGTCAVFCPDCGHSVELPCFDWSSALTCLPSDPTVTFDPEEKRSEADGSVDLSEEEMQQSVSGLVFSLESSFPDRPLQISGSALCVSVSGALSSDKVHALAQVCGNVSLFRGQYYWEVDVCNSDLYRIGVTSLADSSGWWFERSGSSFHTVFDGMSELLPFIPPKMKTVGVFLNVGGASITFHNPITQEILASVPSHFSVPLRPALQLGQGLLRVRTGLSPPLHVFFSQRSSFRGSEGAEKGRWRPDVRFRSVKAVVQKFEENFALSDSDPGPNSTTNERSIPNRQTSKIYKNFTQASYGQSHNALA